TRRDVHGVELHHHAVRIHLEADPGNGAGVLRAHVYGVAHLDPVRDSVRNDWGRVVRRHRLNRDGDDIGVPATAGRVFGETLDVERPCGRPDAAGPGRRGRPGERRGRGDRVGG